MDDNPVQLTYKYGEDRWFDLRFNMHCRVSEWGTFREALVREGQLDRWMNGVFGHFLRMRGDQYFGGKLCQILLCQEIEYPGAREDEMWFKVGGKAMRYRKEEFLLCTGLRFGPLPNGIMSHYPANNDGVQQRYFGKRHIHINKVKLKLEEGNFTRDDDMMKLAYVFFIAHFLLGRERQRTVPDWLWGLVEDLVAFENFLWGTYIYSSTIYWLGKVLRSRVGGRSKKKNLKDKTLAKKQNLGIIIYKFSWLLMIYALEAIPSLNSKCGIRLGDGIPRVCRWYYKKKPTGLVNEFKDDVRKKYKVLTTLTASEDEMKQDYYKICIYDSLSQGKDSKQQIKDIEPLTRFLPSMLRCRGFFDHTNIDPWVDGIDVSMVNHRLLPQQPPGVSCGAFVIKYMENIMTFKDHK
ncbi:hypothetical protein ACOSQ2_022955 [Xanthoceras sorbifolium]